MAPSARSLDSHKAVKELPLHNLRERVNGIVKSVKSVRVEHFTTYEYLPVPCAHRHGGNRRRV